MEEITVSKSNAVDIPFPTKIKLKIKKNKENEKTKENETTKENEITKENETTNETKAKKTRKTHKEYLQGRKDYYEANKTKILDKQKAWNDIHKDTISKRNREQYEKRIQQKGIVEVEKRKHKPHKQHIHRPKPEKTTKGCSMCKEIKNMCEFYTKRSTYCKVCFKIYQNSRYKTIKNEIDEYNKSFKTEE